MVTNRALDLPERPLSRARRAKLMGQAAARMVQAEHDLAIARARIAELEAMLGLRGEPGRLVSRGMVAR